MERVDIGTGRRTPLAQAAGLEATAEFHPRLTREERRSLELHRAIALRMRADPTSVLARAGRNLARMVAATDERSQPLREWAVLLDRPLEMLLPVRRRAAPQWSCSSPCSRPRHGRGTGRSPWCSGL